MGLFCRLVVCITFICLLLYKYIDNLNEITELRRLIPILTKELKEIDERNVELQYFIDQFESPAHLMELARKPEFGHLRYPSFKELIFLPETPLTSSGND